MKSKYTLYLITDRGSLKHKTLVEAVDNAIEGGVTMVQLREKNLSYSEFKKMALEIQKITTAKQIPLIINDNILLAKEIGADGIHLGQTDNFRFCRDQFKHGIIGLSASSLEEAKIALEESPDYLGIGSIFNTQTKPDAKIISHKDLIQILNISPVPVVAIGGITLEKIKNLKKMGVKNFAISSSILNNENDITKNSKEFLEEICKKY